MLPAAHVLICPATTVGPAGNGRIVAVELPVAPTARPVVAGGKESDISRLGAAYDAGCLGDRRVARHNRYSPRLV